MGSSSTDLSGVIGGIIKPPTVSTATSFTLSVYVDPSLRVETEKALNVWEEAFAEKGLEANFRFVDDLSKGVGLLVLDADNESTKMNYSADTYNVEDDAMFEMGRNLGLAGQSRHIIFTDLDSTDKYNKTNSVTTNDLKNSTFIVQINSDLISKSGYSVVNTLKHELGHIFGLDHDDSDSLMTTYPNDPDFTGKISKNGLILSTAHVLRNISLYNR